MSRYRAGVIGLGNIGFRYALDPLRKWVSSHLQAYKEHPDYIPVAVCDIDEAKMADARKYLPEVKCFVSWEEMLRKVPLDILSICVSPEQNYEICISEELKGVKAVVLEKPLALNLSHGRSIIEALRRKKIMGAVNYFRRWQSTFIRLKEILSAGKIGKVIRVRAFHPNGTYIGGSHMIDIIQYLIGDIQEVRALNKIDLPGISDPGYSIFGKSGRIEVYLGGFNKEHFNISDLEIWGEKGRILVTDFNSRMIMQEAVASRRFNGQKEIGEAKEIEVGSYDHYFIDMLNNLADVMSGKAVKIFSTPEDALRTVNVIEAVQLSYASGGANIAVKGLIKNER